ncbi:hypothetical protein CCR75_000912 [Bremia lactucae]|uniref:Protein kinase domain-containing protein n=1 Tax=Bremia lactucae TaxID=4779 RepID=A0A976FKY2_BRELC|nr:hypothetical protein CCR75_000912 [Bremia lactucae]
MVSPGRVAVSPNSSFVLVDVDNTFSPNETTLLRNRTAPSHVSPGPRRPYPPPPTVRSHDDTTMRNEHERHATNRLDSVSNLFPMPGNNNVFTTSANILPTREASILIDTDVQQAAAAQDASHRLPTQQPTPSSVLLPITTESKGEVYLHNRNTHSTNPSNRQDMLENDLRGFLCTPRDYVRSHQSILAGLPPLRPVERSARCAQRIRKSASWLWRQLHRWQFRQNIASIWKRMMPNWDSYVLIVVFIMALVSIPLAVFVAKIVSDATPHRVHLVVQCALPGRTEYYTASTLYLAGVLVPAMNNLVILIVSLWIGFLCSRSRARMLRSNPCSISSNLKSAFMLPCYEGIWYFIAALSAIGLVLYMVSFQAFKSDQGTTYVPLSAKKDPTYPCSLVTMPSVWILQLLPMLMVQRSVSQEAVLRAIGYSGAVCIALVLCNMTLYKVARTIADAIEMVIYVLLLVFYFWAKFVFHARATFDFFFVVAVITSMANILSVIVGIAHIDATTTPPVVHCIAMVFEALLVVAIMLSLRADTRYWLAIDDNAGSGATKSSSAMRRYLNLLSERGMITNFSTRTSVYDVHHMIEEHRHNVVDFAVLALDCIIAQGATSVVMRGTLRRSTPVPIALKIYTDVQVTSEEVQRFSRETALNVQLSHPNVVHFYGLCVVPPSISLIFEFCEYGALDGTLRTSPEIWTLAAKLKAWLDACRAVAYLHSFSPPLLHRDIKTDNFLIGQDFLLKLADFGEANLLRPRTDGTMTIAGTVDYMAPEMIKGGKTARYGTAVDVYSLMITLWQIMVPSRSPWEDKSHLQVYRAVAQGERPPLLSIIPKACADILVAGWAANPNERVAVEDIIPAVHRLWLLAMHQKPLKRTKGY